MTKHTGVLCRFFITQTLNSFLRTYLFLAVDSVPCDNPPWADHVENNFRRAGLSPWGPQCGSERGVAEAAAGPGADSAWPTDRWAQVVPSVRGLPSEDQSSGPGSQYIWAVVLAVTESEHQNRKNVVLYSQHQSSVSHLVDSKNVSDLLFLKSSSDWCSLLLRWMRYRPGHRNGIEMLITVS